jgi:P-type Cu+ transporter
MTRSTLRFALAASAAALVSVAVFVPSITRADEPSKSSASAANAPVLCAVLGKEIKDISKAHAKLTEGGKTYYVCCGGCEGKFKAEPAKFAKLTDLRTEKIVLQRKLDAVNAELATMEAGGEKKAQATPKPAAATTAAAALHCAITDEVIESAEKAGGKVEHAGKTYYFCCPGCVSKFNSDPAKYAKEADARTAKN